MKEKHASEMGDRMVKMLRKTQSEMRQYAKHMRDLCEDFIEASKRIEERFIAELEHCKAIDE